MDSHPAGLDSGYSRRALARLAFSVAAKELSDQARGSVSTRSDGYARPGDFLEEALALRAQVEWLLTRAVVLERERGTSWAEIGERLEASKQAAHERYNKLEDDRRSALDEPWAPQGAGTDALVCQLPDGDARSLTIHGGQQ
jgi:hypothetical protein